MQLLAYALSNIVQYFKNNQDQFFGLVIIVLIVVLLAVIHEGLKAQYKREDQPFDESSIYK